MLGYPILSISIAFRLSWFALGSVLVPNCIHASDLVGSKVVHAAVVRVVHEVMDGVLA